MLSTMCRLVLFQVAMWAMKVLITANLVELAGAIPMQGQQALSEHDAASPTVAGSFAMSRPSTTRQIDSAPARPKRGRPRLNPEIPRVPTGSTPRVRLFKHHPIISGPVIISAHDAASSGKAEATSLVRQSRPPHPNSGSSNPVGRPFKPIHGFPLSESELLDAQVIDEKTHVKQHPPNTAWPATVGYSKAAAAEFDKLHPEEKLPAISRANAALRNWARAEPDVGHYQVHDVQKDGMDLVWQVEGEAFDRTGKRLKRHKQISLFPSLHAVPHL
ncbi:hypothetical protein IE81DRAFT_142618 [Ceraceosorus guamensis]|uniref:Uncharacterized protein n=1 Tax=Ceraceosorus guamensis TaxID=1522189 RepID=A0A316VXD5_9BASI|nr:hypothetical protein IE81DRAFT_142618 [Ceraceosorus guamensis]PWN42109.1 hypothetical protein IE81DRAFT_142618 [Ceraceosorus guamensis]